MNDCYAMGAIYCHPDNDEIGAGHFRIYDNVGYNQTFNCYTSSSRPGCQANVEDGYDCNNENSMALCCKPSSTCGNGIVDGDEEECDDGNTNDDDECMNNCAIRMPDPKCD